jgi:hypothetical protein
MNNRVEVVSQYAAGPLQTYEGTTSKHGFPVAAPWIDTGLGYARSNGWARPPLYFPTDVRLMIPGVAGEASGAITATNLITANKGVWADSTEYAKGDLVFSSGFWVCIVAHVGPGDASTTPAVDGGHWRSTPWIYALGAGTALSQIVAATMTHANVLTSCAALYFAGMGPWRAANLFEVINIANYGIATGFDSAIFHLAASRYWLSSADPNFSSYATQVLFNQGVGGLGCVALGAADKTTSFLPLPVFGGYINP